MKINKNDPKLTAFVLGELSPSEHTLVEEAIKADPELQKEILLLQKTIGVLSQTQESEVYRLDPAQREKLFPKVSTWSIWTLGGSFVTASLALMLYKQTNYEQPTEMAKAPEIVAEAPAEMAQIKKPEPTLNSAPEAKEKVFQPAAKQELAKGSAVSDGAAMDKEVALGGAGSGAPSGAVLSEGYATSDVKADAVAPAPQKAASVNKLQVEEAEAFSSSDSMVASRGSFAKKRAVAPVVESDENSVLVEQLQSCFTENSKHSVLVTFNIKQQTPTDLKIEGTGLTTEVKACITTLINNHKWDGLKIDYKLKIDSK